MLPENLRNYHLQRNLLPLLICFIDVICQSYNSKGVRR